MSKKKGRDKRLQSQYLEHKYKKIRKQKRTKHLKIDNKLVKHSKLIKQPKRINKTSKKEMKTVHRSNKLKKKLNFNHITGHKVIVLRLLNQPIKTNIKFRSNKRKNNTLHKKHCKLIRKTRRLKSRRLFQDKRTKRYHNSNKKFTV